MRKDGRKQDELRDIQITPHVNEWAEGSVEIKMGKTHVICTASVSESTPKWMNEPEKGWITGEYGMLPRANDTRVHRERTFSSGRSQEISRLIGRSLRAAVDLKKLGERQIQIDCDVLQADGGTRTAAINGGFVALALALNHLKTKSLIPTLPLTHYVSAVSVGLLHGECLLDLNSKEDKSCEADVNFVFNSEHQFIEVQGTAEKNFFSEKQFAEMIQLAKTGCDSLFQKQKQIIQDFFEKN